MPARGRRKRCPGDGGVQQSEPAVAQSAAETADAQQVTIEGRRRSVQIHARTFISQLTARTGENSLQRWRQPICPLVAGLKANHGEIVLGRLSQIAVSVGAPLGPRDCQANFFVVLTGEPEQVLRAWRKEDRHVFDQARAKRIRQFIETPRVVRVMHNVEFEDVNGFPLPRAQPNIIREPVVVNKHARDTRIEYGGVRDIWSAIVVVDTTRLKGLKLGQLADYIGMVGMTKLNLDTDVEGVPSILTLFSESPHEATPEGLSTWDHAFLKGLYQTRQASRVQRGLIEQRIVEDLMP